MLAPGCSELVMYVLQWVIASITATFVAVVAFFQWRTAQQKAVLDLFERREAIYQVVRKAVSTVASNAAAFDPAREVEFLQAIERAYFFFGDDVVDYLKQLWEDITEVQTADAELKDEKNPAARGDMVAKRRVAMDRITQFHTTGQPLFAKYMRFSQHVPMSLFDYPGRLMENLKRK
jgi:hypothetical protein